MEIRVPWWEEPAVSCWSRRLRRTWVVVATAGLLAVPASAAAAYGAETPSPPVSTGPTADDTRFPQLTPEIARQLDDAIRKVMRETQVPGVIVGLWAPGKGQYVRTFGVSDKDTGKPMSTDFYSRIGSETKTFTVTALLELVDQHKVGLDDPIAKYVDGVPNGDHITLRQLAGMRSGLYSYTTDETFAKDLFADPERSFTPQELLAYAWKRPGVQFQPGERFDYCNTNLILLGLVVEKVTGRPLQDVIGQDVVKRAGLQHTLFPTNAAFPEPHAQGYSDQTATGKVENVTDWNPSWGWAAGAMISNLQDLRRWAGVLADGTLLTPATQAQRLKTEPTGIKGAGYGLGIFNVQGWIGHNGSLPGYQSLTIHLPGSKATLVFLSNTDISHNGFEPSILFGQAITQIVTPDHVFFLPKPVSEPKPSTPPSS
ncbi:serine hydrolase domain-containing protein [Streptomyces sp. NPDC060028]|uniref:serine hydrolase domain-containing protein n=1 Tax=Streptomyces sp. NPDC060028 TaxID=3347041 RepID=UPI0036875A33